MHMLLRETMELERVFATPTLLQHRKRIVMRVRVEASVEIIPLMTLFKSLFDSLNVDTGISKVFLTVELAQPVLNVRLTRLSSDKSGLVVPSRSEDVRPLSAGSDTTTSIVAERTFHSVLLVAGADRDTCVQSRKQGVDVKLG